MISIQNYFKGIGIIEWNYPDGLYYYKVIDINDLRTTIIPHFNKYPLLSNTYKKYIIFKQIVMSNKECVGIETIKAILNDNIAIN